MLFPGLVLAFMLLVPTSLQPPGVNGRTVLPSRIRA